jgi:hypothetical protein
VGFTAAQPHGQKLDGKEIVALQCRVIGILKVHAMSPFDLLFIGVFFATLVSLVLIALAVWRRQYARALSRLRRLAIAVGVYLGGVVLVSVVSPRRELHVGDGQCWDDWCLAVTTVRSRAGDGTLTYELTFRISSRARRRAQRARDTQVYLTDDLGRRYDPVPDPAAVPFDVLLQPGEDVTVTRVFHLPSDARDPTLVATHGGWFPGLFIIGDTASLFHKPTIVRLE